MNKSDDIPENSKDEPGDKKGRAESKHRPGPGDEDNRGEQIWQVIVEPPSGPGIPVLRSGLYSTLMGVDPVCRL